MQILGKIVDLVTLQNHLTLAEFDKISTSSDLNPFFCFTPAANGFITPTSVPIFRNVIANPAVMYVLPTSVSVPVMKIDFNILLNFYPLINSSVLKLLMNI